MATAGRQRPPGSVFPTGPTYGDFSVESEATHMRVIFPETGHRPVGTTYAAALGQKCIIN